MAVELGVAVLAAERAPAAAIGPLEELVAAMDGLLGDFPAYRQADVRFHVGLAEATGSTALVAAMTEAQAAMTDLIHYIAHPREVLAWSNAQHARLVTCLERHDSATAMARDGRAPARHRARARGPAPFSLTATGRSSRRRR